MGNRSDRGIVSRETTADSDRPIPRFRPCSGQIEKVSVYACRPFRRHVAEIVRAGANRTGNGFAALERRTPALPQYVSRETGVC